MLKAEKATVKEGLSSKTCLEMKRDWYWYLWLFFLTSSLCWSISWYPQIGSICGTTNDKENEITLQCVMYGGGGLTRIGESGDWWSLVQVCQHKINSSELVIKLKAGMDHHHHHRQRRKVSDWIVVIKSRRMLFVTHFYFIAKKKR